jgi:hypothetical protein
VPEPEGDAQGRSLGLRIAAACQVKDDDSVTAAAVLTVLQNAYSQG